MPESKLRDKKIPLLMLDFKINIINSLLQELINEAKKLEKLIPVCWYTTADLFTEVNFVNEEHGPWANDKAYRAKALYNFCNSFHNNDVVKNNKDYFHSIEKIKTLCIDMYREVHGIFIEDEILSKLEGACPLWDELDKLAISKLQNQKLFNSNYFANDKEYLNRALYDGESRIHVFGIGWGNRLKDPALRELADIKDNNKFKSLFSDTLFSTKEQDIRKEIFYKLMKENRGNKNSKENIFSYFENLDLDKNMNNKPTQNFYAPVGSVTNGDTTHNGDVTMQVSDNDTAPTSPKSGKSKAIWVAIITAVSVILAAGITSIFGH